MNQVGAFDDEDTTSLLVSSAKAGFRNLASGFLVRVASILGLDWKSMPKEQRVLALVDAVMPGASKGEVKDALLARSMTATPSTTSLGDPSSWACGGIFDEFDLKRVKEVAAKGGGGNSEAHRRMQEFIRGSTRLSDGPPAHAPARQPVARDATAAPKAPAQRASRVKTDCSHFLPPVGGGCSIQRIEQRRCWIAFYPGVSPASRTRTWGHFPELACRNACLQWAWNHHTRLTGEACPHEI